MSDFPGPGSILVSAICICRGALVIPENDIYPIQRLKSVIVKYFAFDCPWAEATLKAEL